MSKIFRVPLRWAGLLALAVSAAGCDYFYDEVEESCAVDYLFSVKAYDSLGAEQTAASVNRVTIYLYDENQNFLRSIDAQLGELLSVKLPHGVESYTAVAWGNLAEEGSQSFTPPALGEPLSSARVALAQGSGSGIFASPDDLFRGTMTMTPTNWTEGKVLSITRETGQFSVTIRNLQAFSGYTDNNFSVEVGRTASALDFNGNAISTVTASYRPSGSFVANGTRTEWQVPAFRMLPGNSLSIKISHGTEIVATIDRAEDGSLITLAKGRQTNVLIDLQSEIRVGVELAPWGVNTIVKDFEY